MTDNFADAARMPANEIRVVAAVITMGHSLLVVRKRRTSCFMLPGGKPENDEDDVSCLVRELQEELSVDFDRESAAFLGCFTVDAANEPGERVAARIYRVLLKSSPVPRAEIEEMLWLNCTQSTDQVALAPLLNEAVLPLLRAADDEGGLATGYRSNSSSTG
jgi:8-oxo-dGTP diphosphatase